eukprot:TRINITY_DN24619_c0_g1_i1.p1 TRINITY_DN24619_c0_g1~~TRINITY_DN24619_c0_g1_i1.p1  ORF type:complete len:233 (+),score=63.60 TRINITY_DN24619_c0_g1_i1:109-807(+)
MQQWGASRTRGNMRSSRDFGEHASDAATAKSEEQVSWWKVVTLSLVGISILMLVVLIVLIVFHFHFRKCSVWLSDVTINGRPTPPSGVLDSASEGNTTVPLLINIAVSNPTKTVAQLQKLSLSVILADLSHQHVLNASEHIEYTGSIDIPADVASVVSLQQQVTFEQGQLANKLLYKEAGCFNLTVAGVIGYKSGFLSFTTDLKQSFRLFEQGACPCPGTQPPAALHEQAEL